MKKRLYSPHHKIRRNPKEREAERGENQNQNQPWWFGLPPAAGGLNSFDHHGAVTSGVMSSHTTRRMPKKAEKNQNPVFWTAAAVETSF